MPILRLLYWFQTVCHFWGWHIGFGARYCCNEACLFQSSAGLVQWCSIGRGRNFGIYVIFSLRAGACVFPWRIQYNNFTACFVLILAPGFSVTGGYLAEENNGWRSVLWCYWRWSELLFERPLLNTSMCWRVISFCWCPLPSAMERFDTWTLNTLGRGFPQSHHFNEHFISHLVLFLQFSHCWNFLLRSKVSKSFGSL